MRNKIKLLREDRGFSQEDMAKRLFMDKRTYQRIESGEKKSLDFDLLQNIAKILEVGIMELITTDSVTIEHIGDNSENNGAIGYNNEVTVNNNGLDNETKNLVDELMQQMREVIEEKNKTIAVLQELLSKKKF